MAISSSHFDLLQQELQNSFIPHLPTLLSPSSIEDENKKKNLSRALSAFVISKLCDVPAKTAAESVVDDFHDQGIDAIFLHGETLYVVQSKLKYSEQFKQEEAHSFCEGVRQLIKSDFVHFNQHVQKRITDIENAIENCSSIQLVVSHIGDGISEPAKLALNRFLKGEEEDEERLNPDVIDFDCRLVSKYLQEGNKYQSVNTRLKIEYAKSLSDPRLSYFGFIKLSDLVSLHREHGKALYEKNIRTFLGMGQKHQVNESIRETLVQNPKEFCYLNNGVTALCQRIEPKNINSGKRNLKITGLSVINGAQTISSAAYAAEQGVDISQAKVLLTLIKADADTDFANRVTKARNHQNPVSLSDFAALHDDQERLRREAAYLDITYEYKAGHDDGTYDERRIRLDEAVTALALCHPDPRYSVWLKKEPEKLHNPDSKAYKGLFPPDLSVHTLINAVYFSRYLKQRMLSEENAATGSNRLTYKHGVYGLGWVLAKRFNEAISSTTLLDMKLLQDKASIPFDELRNRFETQISNHDKGALSIFRNQTHTLPLLSNVMLEDYGLRNDSVIQQKQASTVTGQDYPIELFKYMISKAPQIKLIR